MPENNNTGDSENTNIKWETMSFDGDLPETKAGVRGFDIALGEVRTKLGERFSSAELHQGGEEVRSQARIIAKEVHVSYQGRAIKENLPPLHYSPDDFVTEAISYTFGLGPIDHLLEDETIEDIAINGPNEVMIYRDAYNHGNAAGLVVVGFVCLVVGAVAWPKHLWTAVRGQDDEGPASPSDES